MNPYPSGFHQGVFVLHAAADFGVAISVAMLDERLAREIEPTAHAQDTGTRGG